MVTQKELNRYQKPDYEFEGQVKWISKITELSNYYYSLIPRPGFWNDILPKLNSKYQIANEMRFLNNLITMDLVNKIIMGALQN